MEKKVTVEVTTANGTMKFDPFVIPGNGDINTQRIARIYGESYAVDNYARVKVTVRTFVTSVETSVYIVTP